MPVAPVRAPKAAHTWFFALCVTPAAVKRNEPIVAESAGTGATAAENTPQPIDAAHELADKGAPCVVVNIAVLAVKETKVDVRVGAVPVDFAQTIRSCVI